MTRLLKYYFTKKWLLIVILAFAALQITFISTTSVGYIHTYCEDHILDIWKEEPANPPIIAPTIIAAVLASIVPFIEFSFKMRKVNIDQYYSLPIKREKLYLSTYIFGFLEVIIPTSVSYLVSFISIYTKPSMFEAIYFLPYYFILVGITLVLYTIVTFIYTRNNTFADGLVNVILSMFVLCIVTGALNSALQACDVIDKNFMYLDSSWYILYSPHTYMSSMFGELLCDGYLSYYGANLNVALLSLSIFVVIGIVCFILFIKLIKTDKAESCSQISNSFISYRVMIPIYTVSSMVLLRSTSIFVIILVSIAAFFLYVLYHRSFRFKKGSIITLIACCVVGLTLALIFEEVGTHYGIEALFGGVL